MQSNNIPHPKPPSIGPSINLHSYLQLSEEAKRLWNSIPIPNKIVIANPFYQRALNIANRAIDKPQSGYGNPSEQSKRSPHYHQNTPNHPNASPRTNSRIEQQNTNQ